MANPGRLIKTNPKVETIPFEILYYNRKYSERVKYKIE